MQRILLVGASGGVGQAVARQLLDRGFDVWGSVLSERELEATRQQVAGLANAFIADFSDADRGKAQLEAALQRGHGPLRAVIGCAGVNPYGPLETTTLALFRETMEVNALANLAAYQVAMPHLRHGQGRLIFLSSYTGKVAAPLLGNYVASKHALEGLADVMRLEAGQWGIPVSLIESGAVRTPMLSTFHESLELRLREMADDERRHYGPYFEQYQQFFANAGDGFLSAQEVADTVLQVLDAPNPRPRYAIGNAVDLIEQRKALSDEAMDALWNALMPGIGRVAPS